MGARRGSPRTALAALALLAAVLGCGPLPPPSTAAGRSGAPPPGLSQQPPTGTAGLDEIPAILFAGPTGLAVSIPGRPDTRVPVRLPPGPWQATAAVGPLGDVLLVSKTGTSPATILLGRLDRTTVAPIWRIVLPPGHGDALPGCVSGDGDATVVADALLVIGPDGVRAVRDVPPTAGRCQMPDPDTVVYLGEDDHAVVAWSLHAGTATRSLTRCDDLSLAGPWLACLGVGGGTVVVGQRGPAGAAEPILLAPVSVPIDGLMAQVLLTPDGERVAAVAAAHGGVAVYRRTAEGTFTLGGAFSLRPGETMLGFVGPW